MCAISNGIAAYGGLIPFASTFVVFTGYALGAMRLSALSHFRVVYVYTHDSVGLGEDGPTHQPIETLAHLRAIPNFLVFRPADGNETSGACVAPAPCCCALLMAWWQPQRRTRTRGAFWHSLLASAVRCDFLVRCTIHQER